MRSPGLSATQRHVLAIRTLILIIRVLVYPPHLPIMDNRPKVISDAEWKEIVSLAAVRDAWSLDDDFDPLDFASLVYGAKFDFVSGGPGYVGDIYVLQGDPLTEVPPMVLRRDQRGQLIVC